MKVTYKELQGSIGLKHLPLLVIYFIPSLILFLLNVRFLRIWKLGRIGHVAMELDCYLKDAALGRRPKCRGIVLAKRETTANPRFLDYFGEHITIVSNSTLRFLLKPFLLFPYLNVLLWIDGLRVNYAETATAWGNRPPLLRLSDEDRARGWKILRELGVPQGAWFVCFHSRESGYGNDAQTQSYRDSRIESYRPAMEEVISRGGWCVRMGDKTMQPLEPLEGAIDYALSAFKSDWMDVFLCAECRFFAGNTSGLFLISSAFGKPVIIANNVPMEAASAFHPSDRSLPKLIVKADGNLMSFAEIFDSGVAVTHGVGRFDDRGLRVQSNSAEEIRDVTIEMIKKLEGKAVYTEEDERLQAAFKQLFLPGHYSYGSAARIGRDFLRQHARLLDETPRVRAFKLEDRIF